MTFYSELAATADQLIEEFGADATLKRVTAGTYSADTGGAAPTESSSPVMCVVFDFANKDIDGTLVISGDKDCYMRVKGGVAPRTGDVLVWDGMDYRVVGFKPLAPALVAVLWQLQLRYGG